MNNSLVLSKLFTSNRNINLRLIRSRENCVMKDLVAGMRALHEAFMLDRNSRRAYCYILERCRHTAVVLEPF